MTYQKLKSFNKLGLLKLKVLALSFIFIFCFEGSAGPCEEALSSSTRTPSTTSEEYSVRSSVWKLSIQGGGNGTGFFIASNKLITNFHVINTALRYVSKIEDIILSQEGSAKTLKVKGILAVSALHDLALLETTGSVDHYLPIRRKPLQGQEDVFLTGYPGGKLTDIGKTNYMTISSIDISSFIDHYSLLGGASGSPLVDAKKQVVGVIYGGTSFSLHSVNLNDLQVFIQRGLRSKLRDNPKQIVKREIQNLRNLAKRKNAQAQFQLGLIYFNGYGGVPQSYEKAVDLFKQAAEQGNAQAQFQLGLIYFNGYGGVPQSYEKAVDLFKQAAEQGNAQAQYNLGSIYFNGYGGVPQSYETAIYWYKKAGEQGLVDAQVEAGRIYLDNKGGLQSYEKAVDLFKQAAEQGNADAQFKLGVMYFVGNGVIKSYEKAGDLFKQASEQGHADAKTALEAIAILDKG